MASREFNDGGKVLSATTPLRLVDAVLLAGCVVTTVAAALFRHEVAAVEVARDETALLAWRQRIYGEQGSQAD